MNLRTTGDTSGSGCSRDAGVYPGEPKPQRADPSAKVDRKEIAIVKTPMRQKRLNWNSSSL
jgi:hypothetical protein